MRRSPALRAGFALLAVLVHPPAPAAGQTIVGRVLDGVNEAPVGGALVLLIDRQGAERARILADSAGRFVLEPPEAGQYYLSAERLGYQPTSSPLLALSRGGSAPVDLLMEPQPVGLEGFEISVEAQALEYLAQFGLTANDLGNRFIDRSTIEAVEAKRDVGNVLEWQQIGGMRVIRPENLRPGSDDMGLCVSLVRARTGSGQGRCAMVVWNGVPISGSAALELDPDAVEAMALLNPVEATFYYGTMGEGGALLVWTRR